MIRFHTPKVLSAATRGDHWATAVLEGAGMRWTLSDVVVAGYQPGGGSGEADAVEVWSLSAAKLELG